MATDYSPVSTLQKVGAQTLGGDEACGQVCANLTYLSFSDRSTPPHKSVASSSFSTVPCPPSSDFPSVDVDSLFRKSPSHCGAWQQTQVLRYHGHNTYHEADATHLNTRRKRGTLRNACTFGTLGCQGVGFYRNNDKSFVFVEVLVCLPKDSQPKKVIVQRL